MSGNKFQQAHQSRPRGDTQQIKEYFTTPKKYQRLAKSNDKIGSMISAGEVTVHPQSKLPPLEPKPTLQQKRRMVIDKYNSLTPKQKHNYMNEEVVGSNSRISHDDRDFVRLRDRSKVTEPLSKHNIRIMESLIKKYNVLFENTAKGSKDDEKLELQRFRLVKKLNQYQQALQKSQYRLPHSYEQEDYLDNSPRNLRMKEQMFEDLTELKQCARELNCSIHRKGKHYEPVNEIRRRFKQLHPVNEKYNPQNSREKDKVQNAPVAIGSMEDNRYRRSITEPSPQIVESKPNESKQELTKHSKKEALRKTIVKQMGNDYLHFSRKVGINSRQISKKEKGSIKFVKEILHHWWMNNPVEMKASPTPAPAPVST